MIFHLVVVHSCIGAENGNWSI